MELSARPANSGDLPDGPGGERDARRQYHGIFSAYIENDIFLSSDDNYTSGVGLSWTSDDSKTYKPKTFTVGLVRVASFLPTIGDSRYRNFVALTLGQEIYTPTDIESPIPPPDQQPYAGVVFLDTSVYGYGKRSLHDFTMRLGCVGPCSGAEQVQKNLHEMIGSPIPQGWDHQLGNELLINLDYRWDRRLLRRIEPHRLHYDLTIRFGAGLGNYYSGANAGIGARLGHNLPDNYGAASFRTGGASSFVGLTPPPGRGWQGYVFIGFQTFAVARFLPTDGNTFQDGPSVERDDFVQNLATGFVVGYGRVVFSWTLNNFGGLTDFTESRASDFGTIAFSYYWMRKTPSRPVKDRSD